MSEGLSKSAIRESYPEVDWEHLPPSKRTQPSIFPLMIPKDEMDAAVANEECFDPLDIFGEIIADDRHRMVLKAMGITESS